MLFTYLNKQPGLDARILLLLLYIKKGSYFTVRVNHQLFLSSFSHFLHSQLQLRMLLPSHPPKSRGYSEFQERLYGKVTSQTFVCVLYNLVLGCIIYVQADTSVPVPQQETTNPHEKTTLRPVPNISLEPLHSYMHLSLSGF